MCRIRTPNLEERDYVATEAPVVSDRSAHIRVHLLAGESRHLAAKAKLERVVTIIEQTAVEKASGNIVKLFLRHLELDLVDIGKLRLRSDDLNVVYCKLVAKVDLAITYLNVDVRPRMHVQ